jgi:predicted transcriptional regulator
LARRAGIALDTVVRVEKGRNFEQDTLLKIVAALKDKDHDHRLQAVAVRGIPSGSRVSTADDLVAAGQRSATGVGEMSDLEDPDFQLVRAIYHRTKALGPGEHEEFMRRVLAAGNTGTLRRPPGKERSLKKARRR